ncbi:hypothetical protein ABZ611_33945 [Streptomyces sp. NPDC007861]|uniref:hypothetical protein n=1 Tax=Streptomyces sp. NPDC007861 TaxID=3154893 RepID=UPI003400BA87
MVTAWTSSSNRRTRLSAGPLRLLWLAALLFSLVYTHGVSAETAAAHMTTSTAAAPAAHAGPDHKAVPAPDEDTPADHHDDGQDSHPAGECVSGQPQQAAGLSAPAPAPYEGQSPYLVTVAGKSGVSGDRSALPPPRSTMASVIQRI